MSSIVAPALACAGRGAGGQWRDPAFGTEALPGVHGFGVSTPPPARHGLAARTPDRDRRHPRVYVTGDTCPATTSTRSPRYPDVDAPRCTWHPVLAHTVTMDGEMFGDFLRRVRPRRAVPVHYDDYGVMVSGLDDARAAARAAGFAERLEIVPRGGTVALARSPPRSDAWPVANAHGSTGGTTRDATAWPRAGDLRTTAWPGHPARQPR